MLSIENPPPDPSCSCQFQQLNSTNSDERASHKLEVDLLKSAHDHLPKFSIRDYVFTSRSKDIKKNWPFSLKNLQLCLKHGVKDVLPPFQALDAVKTQSTKKWTVETGSLEKKSISNFDEEPSGPNNNEVLDSADNVQLNHKLESACIDTSSCRSPGENDFPSTTTSVSQSEIESVPTERPSSSPPETDTLLEASASATVEVEAGHPTSHKTENTTRPPGKKCRLIVKFSGNSDRSSTEDIASNSTGVSETMASKVCPVCKTFTSSSNTTLNAHIDQCLSAESTPKWTADSKVTRHRIKPRKTRLMVDVYSTAQRCTLEELDRRNGTSWATISSLPAQDAEKQEIPAEGKRQRVSQVHPEDAGEVGEVYIDANGTKLRILSKSNDAPVVSKVVEDLQPKNSLKGGKGSKFLSTKKKKRHAKKHLKYQKLAPQSRKFFSHKARASQTSGDQEGYNGVEESDKEKHEIRKQIRSSDSGTLRQWACSKRTGHAKKGNSKAGHQPFRCKWHLARDLLVENDQPSLGETLAERNRLQKYTNLSENLLSSPAIGERMEKPFYNAQVSDRLEHSSGRKRVGSSLFGARISDNMERSLPQTKHKDNQLSEDGPFRDCSHTFEPSNSGRNCLSPLNNKRFSCHGDPDNNSDILPGTSTMPSISTHSFASKALRTLSRKNVSAASSRSSVVKSKPNMDDKCSARKKNRLDQIGVEEEVPAWPSEVDQQYALMHDDIDENLGREEITDNTSFGRSTVPEIRQDRGMISISQENEAPQCYGLDEGVNTDSSARAGDDLLDKVEEGVTSFSNSVDTKFHKLSNCSKTQSNSLHSVENYNGILCGGEALTGPTEPSLVDGQDMYGSDEVGNDIMGQSAHMGPGLDSDIGQGNSFPEVDPIPIPGPPGSFLPSPRDMGSDDFQGNSSLTTSRVQSSQDQLDFVDGDSSDSPISATSTISNSAAARSSLKYPESLSSVGAHAVQGKMRSGFSTVSIEPFVENASVVPQTGTGVEKTYFDGDKFKINKIAIEKRPLSFKNDGQPCCCQRKERISLDMAPNYQESQLLKRRTMASVTLPAMGKQNARPNSFDARPEMFSTLNSCPSFGSEKVIIPFKGSAGSISLKGSPEAAMKFVGHGDCDSPSPSTSNPVLRLMGKNLMVVNKEEDTSVPFGQSQQSAQNSHVISQFPTSSRVSPGNVQNQDCNSFPSMLPQGPIIFNRSPYDSVGPSFDVRLSSSYRNHTNPRTPQTAAQVQAGLLHNQHINGSFVATMESHMYEDAYSLSSRHNRPKIRMSETSSYNMDKVIMSLDRPQKTADGGASTKEIIVIDDIPESEANETTDVAKYSEGLRTTQLISSGISLPTVPSYNSRHGNPFSGYQDPSLLGESPVVHNSNFHAIPSRLPNTSPVRWGCTPEGSGVLQRSSFMAASTSTGHLGSSLYYSPSLS